MAPRRGGGSYGSSTYDGACTYCDVPTQLYGFDLALFPQEAAGVAFGAIVLAGFLALFIASFIGKGTLVNPNKSRATKFGLSWAILCFLISQALGLANNILQDTFAEVMRVYYIISPISYAFSYGADTILPWTILCFIWIRLRALHGENGIVKGLRGMAIGFLSLLTALFVAIVALDIAVTVYFVDYNLTDDYYTILSALFGLILTHICLRAIIAVIATAFAVKLYSDSRVSSTASKIPTLLLGLVTPWLLLREVILIAFTVTAYLGTYNGDGAAYTLASELSYGVVSMIIYAGLVICTFRPEWRYAEVEPQRKYGQNETPWGQPGISVVH